ncbi:protein LITTLE ZIPPER 3 [Senna tora]|uniref:Protein LITTLE ZIPPER 3 n=1 Tax=Senna tora TaxID=362788 RepID=A0A834WIX6_9FABA|nr:protein LITTLE ZIPPER 3 [Senna tora]
MMSFHIWFVRKETTCPNPPQANQSKAWEVYRQLVVMDRVNSELYLQNCYIMKENEKLRKKAELLNQENQALLSQLQQKLSKGNAKGNSSSNTILDLNVSSDSNQKASGSTTN